MKVYQAAQSKQALAIAMYVRLMTAVLLSTSVQSQLVNSHMFAAPPRPFREDGGYEHSGAFASDAMRDQLVFGFTDYPVYGGEEGRYGRDGGVRRHGQESNRRYGG